MRKFFTSESVTEGHPDKVADKIADEILDEALKQDPNSRVACEVALTPNYVLVFGEITTKAKIDYDSIIRKTIKNIGYTKDVSKFNDEDVKIINEVGIQSPDIAMGVDKDDQGAGDQGIMFGFAINETKNLMPISIELAHKLAQRLTKVRKENIVKDILPDGKTQVTIEYFNDQVKRVDTVVISTQHKDNIDYKKLEKDIIEEVIKKVIPSNLIDNETKFLINKTGKFVIGGPEADSGLTGRKLIVDSYGGYSRHGGGAFSGKDPSKMDRSAAYMARYIAKNVVASGVCDKLEVQISYAIGVDRPTSLFLETFNTHKVPVDLIYQKVLEVFDLRPKFITKNLNLLKPVYKHTSSYGHFGRDDIMFSWEETNKKFEFEKLLEVK